MISYEKSAEKDPVNDPQNPILGGVIPMPHT
jgi:hypothetical protein